jgi:hypothetical protein
MLKTLALVVVMVIPSLMAVRAYRMGYRAGQEDRKLMDLLKRRYSKS